MIFQKLDSEILESRQWFCQGSEIICNWLVKLKNTPKVIISMFKFKFINLLFKFFYKIRQIRHALLDQRILNIWL